MNFLLPKAGFILGRFLNDFGDQNDSRTILVGAPIFGRLLNVFGVVCSKSRILMVLILFPFGIIIQNQ